MRLVFADDAIEYDKSFITIEISEGDTLTSLAQEYAVSSNDYSDYIEEVKSINNLKSDTIHSGCYLLVPVYEVVQ
ncbi:MAG: LysM peptidoglycan-binding domain-containing protein [Clostridium sp.]|nr:LysM peptidoglycan-binding domain-containing protein [Clostridium sp.]